MKRTTGRGGWRYAFGLLAAGAFLHMPAAAYDDLTAMSDEFDDAGRIGDWQRIFETEGWGNNVLEAFDVDTSQDGRMVMMPYSSSWFEEFRGELTYKTVTGDFAVTTFVEPRNRAGTGRPERDYSLAGIMVRVPRAMTNASQWTANGQNYVFLSMGSASRVNPGYEFEVKTTSNSTSVLFVEGTDATRAVIQVARIGPHLLMLRQAEGETWQVHRRYYRPDFPATLQAGLTVYTDWDTVVGAGVLNNNTLILTNGAPLNGGGTLAGAQPDLTAAFDYVRYARPAVPADLVGSNLSDAASVSDGQLLAFLGEAVNIPGGAAEPPAWLNGPQPGGGVIGLDAEVTGQRSYRVQSAVRADGPWADALSFVSTGAFERIELPADGSATAAFFRVISP